MKNSEIIRAMDHALILMDAHGLGGTDYQKKIIAELEKAKQSIEEKNRKNAARNAEIRAKAA